MHWSMLFIQEYLVNVLIQYHDQKRPVWLLYKYCIDHVCMCVSGQYVESMNAYSMTTNEPRKVLSLNHLRKNNWFVLILT